MDDELMYRPELIDLICDKLDPSAAAALRSQVEKDARLAQEYREMQEIAGLLSAWRIPSDTQLEDRMSAGVAAKVKALRTPRENELNRPPIILRMGNLRDIIAAAAIVVLVVGLGVPGLLNMKARNQRIGCANNLAMLGQGLQQYAATYASSLPFAGWDSSNSWQTQTGQPGEAMPNRAHVFPLLQQAYVTDPRLFICPSKNDVPLTRDDVRTLQSFPEARNLSYAYFNMAGVRPRVDANNALPILSDDNPLFDNGMPVFRLKRFTHSDPTLVNSDAHRGAGQNVLLLDGHVTFQKTPLAGV
ncbi:MAG: hypothetical protein AB7N71_13180, partial [Phycisphaerae bacterium]